MTQSARYEKGLAKFREIYREQAQTHLDAFEQLDPDLKTYIIEFAFGDIHCRPGLDMRTREIATVAALTALGNAPPQLRAHIEAALNVGVSEDEIVEVIMQMALYAGFPATINAMRAAREVFAERKKR
jgi:4-carboxymuconolactone decarboxylase